MVFLTILITAWFVFLEVGSQVCCDRYECSDMKTLSDCRPDGDYTSSVCQWNGSACIERTSCDGIIDWYTCLSVEYFFDIKCSWNNEVCEVSKTCGNYNSKQTCDAASNCTWTDGGVCETTSCENRQTENECFHHDDCSWVGDYGNRVCRNRTCTNYNLKTDCELVYDCVWINSACRTVSCWNFDSTNCDGVHLRSEYEDGYCQMTGGIYGMCELTTSCGAWSGTGKSDCELKYFETRCVYTADNVCRNATCADYNNGDTNSEQYCNDIGCRYSPSLHTCTEVSSCSDWSGAGSNDCESHGYNGYDCAYETDGTCRPECTYLTSASDCEKNRCYYLDRMSCPPCWLSCRYDDSCTCDADGDNDADSHNDSATAVSAYSTLSIVLMLLLLAFLL